MSRNRRRLGAGLAIAGLAATFISIRIPLHASATLEVVASGLANPRGLNFGPEGGLYVAEAGTGGTGPCIVNSNNQFVCYGETGAITRITLGGVASQARLVTGLPSLAAPPGRPAQAAPRSARTMSNSRDAATASSRSVPLSIRRAASTTPLTLSSRQSVQTSVGSSGSSRTASGPSRRISQRSKRLPILTAAGSTRTRSDCSRCRAGKCSPTPVATLSTPSRPMDQLPAWHFFRTWYRRYGDIPGGANRRGIGTRRESVRRPADWFSVSTGTGECLSRAGERRNAGGLRERLHEDHRPHVWIGRFALRSANQLDRRTSSPRRKRIVDPRVTGRDENDDRSSERGSGGAGWHRDRSRRFDLCDELFGLSQRGHGRQGRSVASVPL